MAARARDRALMVDAAHGNAGMRFLVKIITAIFLYLVGLYYNFLSLRDSLSYLDSELKFTIKVRLPMDSSSFRSIMAPRVIYLDSRVNEMDSPTFSQFIGNTASKVPKLY